MQNKTLTTIVALVVVAVWAASMILAMFNTSYQPPIGIYPALMVVLGGLFGYRLVRFDKYDNNE